MKHLVLKVSMTAGLGDGILALIQALAYAYLTGRVLHVDWRGGWYGMPEKENLFDRIFETQRLSYSPELPSSGMVFPPAWSGSLTKTFTQKRDEDGFDSRAAHFDIKEALRRYSLNYDRQDYEEEILVTWDHYQFHRLVGDLTQNGVIPTQSSKFKAMGHVYNAFLRFKPEPLRYIEQHWESLRSTEEDEKIIGVHVRETEESFNVYGAVSRKKYFSAINRFLRVKSGPELIFLATDNQEVQSAFKKYYGDIVRSKPKWFDEPGQPLHIGTAGRPNNWTNLLDALFEMHALSRCGYLVRRRESSFSRVSQIIGLFPETQVALVSRDQSFNDFIKQVRKLPGRTLRALRSSAGPPAPI